MTEVQIFASPLAETPIGEIAARLPGATALFRAKKLDYCCGGAASLASAAQARGADLAALIEGLEALGAPTPATPEAPAELIEFILSRFHEVHRRELAELQKLARRVEQVHADHPDAPKGLAELVATIAVDLDSHMMKEEQVLFPMMQAGRPMVAGPIAMMEFEHCEHAESLQRLEALTANMTPPADACGSWRALYNGLRKFSDDLREHIHTENNLLFPLFHG